MMGSLVVYILLVCFILNFLQLNANHLTGQCSIKHTYKGQSVKVNCNRQLLWTGISTAEECYHKCCLNESCNVIWGMAEAGNSWRCRLLNIHGDLKNCLVSDVHVSGNVTVVGHRSTSTTSLNEGHSPVMVLTPLPQEVITPFPTKTTDDGKQNTQSQEQRKSLKSFHITLQKASTHSQSQPPSPARPPTTSTSSSAGPSSTLGHTKQPMRPTPKSTKQQTTTEASHVPTPATYKTPPLPAMPTPALSRSKTPALPTTRPTTSTARASTRLTTNIPSKSTVTVAIAATTSTKKSQTTTLKLSTDRVLVGLSSVSHSTKSKSSSTMSSSPFAKSSTIFPTFMAVTTTRTTSTIRPTNPSPYSVSTTGASNSTTQQHIPTTTTVTTAKKKTFQIQTTATTFKSQQSTIIMSTNQKSSIQPSTGTTAKFFNTSKQMSVTQQINFNTTNNDEFNKTKPIQQPGEDGEEDIQVAAPKVNQSVSGTLIAVLVFGIFFTVVVVVAVVKLLYEGWQRRNYHKMDYLINGMYN